MNYLDIIAKIFELVVIPLLGAATMYLITLIKAKRAEAIANTNNETAKKYINMLDKTITECVLATNQTFVEALKKDGSFTEEAQKQAFKLTYDAVMAVLTDDAKEYLTEVVSDLQSYITTKIEAQVVVSKNTIQIDRGVDNVK